MKRGRKEAPIGMLNFWEHVWYWIFHGLAFGISSTTGNDIFWEPQRPPKLEFNSAQVKAWSEEMRWQPWQEIRIKYRTRGKPAEPKVWELLKLARTTNQIRRACDASLVWLNPKANASPFVADLRTHASAFLSAKKYRCPSSNRDSSAEKLVVHSARAMAGIMVGISPVTAIDRLRNLKHGKRCECVNCKIRRTANLLKPITASDS